MSLTNAQFDEIQRMYDKRQLRSRQIQEARIQEAYKKIPLLTELDQRSASLSLKKARIRLQGVMCADRNFDLNAALEEISMERRAALSSGGFSPDYLEPVYQCAKCKDTGFVDGRKCTCFLQAEISLLYDSSNLGSILESENFDHFTLKWYDDQADGNQSVSPRETAADIFRQARDFVRRFDDSFENICFIGNTGVGKTFLSNCIAKELLESGHSVLYLTAFTLFDIFEKHRFSPDDEIRESFSHIFDCDLLIIDDLGTELTNSFVSSKLFLVINERILNKRSTILSTNLSLEQLAENYSERTFSRILSQYRLLKLYGSDIRIKKQLSGGI